MESASVAFVLVLALINLLEAKIVAIPYEDFEICVPPEERAPNFDYSEMEIIVESDTEAYLNGSWNIVEETKSPWNMTIYSEKYERGVWNVQAFQRRIPDFCRVIQSPFEPWYHISSKFVPKNCPFPKGVSWVTLLCSWNSWKYFQTKLNFNMQSLTEVPIAFPTNFVGKWRVTFVSVFDIASGKRECFRVNADLIEVWRSFTLLAFSNKNY